PAFYLPERDLSFCAYHYIGAGRNCQPKKQFVQNGRHILHMQSIAKCIGILYDREKEKERGKKCCMKNI
ncbi:MAG: hypothetical protein MJ118_02855, partial [Clostridia bacterium]|nr:hypothetical protein [Clostridia bacterium]